MSSTILSKLSREEASCTFCVIANELCYVTLEKGRNNSAGLLSEYVSRYVSVPDCVQTKIKEQKSKSKWMYRGIIVKSNSDFLITLPVCHVDLQP